ncbi:MAG: hypothetical protein AAFU85_21850 [Planctomycetota bacterium]
MKLLFRPLRWAYALVRHFGVVDVRWLLHAPSQHIAPAQQPAGYEIRCVPMGELAELIRAGRVDRRVGDYRTLEHADRRLIAAYKGSRIVSFAWLANQTLAGRDNASRWRHLGTSVEVPDGSSFVYNAWTDPDHRGNRLVAALLRWALRNGVGGAWSVATMIDWTNDESKRAFQQLGMRRLGLVIRIGRGPLQFSLLPAAATSVGMRVGRDAPGVKLAS